MDLNARTEQYSIGYVQVLAAVAGVKIDRYVVDDDSLDVLLSRAGGRSPHLSLQLKCSADLEPRSDDFSFRLKLKNYDDLRRLTMVPRILVIVHVPPVAEDWLVEMRDHFLLRHRAYWLNLSGMTEEKAVTKEDWQKKKVTVRIPTANLLTPAQLIQMMDNIERTDAI
jgi:hypothetical protein